MKDRKELHTLIDELGGQTAKRQLHAIVDELNEEQVMATLRRLQTLGKNLHDKWGFSV